MISTKPTPSKSIPIHPVDTVLFGPLFKVLPMEPKDKELLQEILARIILAEVVLRVIKALPENVARDLNDKIAKENKIEEKWKIFREVVKDIPQAQKEIEEYFKKDIVDFAEKLVLAYLKKAPREKQEEFLKLMEAGSSN